MKATRVWPLVILLAAATVGAFLPSPSILGEWESSTIFSTYGVLDNHLSFEIAERGNIGGAGYFPLELSRSILESFGLPSTPGALRLPVIFLGLLGVFLFYLIAKRWFTVWPAVISASLLAINPLYNQYQHELIVAAPSLTAFFFFFERLQFLTLQPRRWLAWITLSLAIILVALLYGPGRILAAITLVAWVAKSMYRICRSANLRLLREFSVQLLTSLFISIVSIFAIDPKNLSALGPQLFFPKNAETLVVTESEIPFAMSLINNIQILVESLVLGGGPHHAAAIESTLSQGRFPIIPLVISPFVALGLLLTFRNFFATPQRWSSPFAAILFLATITSLPMLTSTNFHLSVDGTQQLISTLSPYRLMYFLLPAYLAIAVVSQTALRTRWSAILLVVSSVGLFAYSTHSLIESREALDRKILGGENNAGGRSDRWTFTNTQDDYPSAWTAHLQQHSEYASWSQEFAAQEARLQQFEGSKTIIYIPIRCFPETSTRTRSLDFYDVNFHSLFISIYLSAQLPQSNVGTVFLPPADGAPRTLVEKEGFFGALIAEKTDGQVETIDFDSELGVVRTLNQRPADIVIAMTPQELAFVEQRYQQDSVDFQVINYETRCNAS